MRRQGRCELHKHYEAYFRVKDAGKVMFCVIKKPGFLSSEFPDSSSSLHNWFTMGTSNGLNSSTEATSMGTHTRPSVWREREREREITAPILPEWALLHVTKTHTHMYVKHVPYFLY